LLPQLPRLLHQALQPRPAAEQRALEALLAEQRRTHRLLRAIVWVCLGFVLGLIVTLAVLRLG
jgi:ubiquinone biosynthesis protein